MGITTLTVVAPVRMLAALAQAAPTDGGPTALTDFWNLVEQAGPLRWPIFTVLGIGLLLVFLKGYELLRDRKLSGPLLDLDVEHMSLDQITAAVAEQRHSILAGLQSAMLNVFHTRPTEGMLHDEIVNFLAFEQDQFAVFRRRMEFLSDTAGALGLMGTVWGMFQVFFQGTSDKDVILRGMGIALITTLLGLVVSIILNLFATELSTVFGKRLEAISRKSDELRFRLLELAADARPAPAAPAPEPAPAAAPPPPPPPPPPSHDHSGRAGASRWSLDAAPSRYVARAGETLKSLTLQLIGTDGEQPGGLVVTLSVPPDAGALDGGELEVRRTADDEGRIEFAWTVPERAGNYMLDAGVAGYPEAARRLHLVVRPGAAHRVEREGNNQAAVAGMRLGQPIGVLVFDRFDNPVPGVPVTFTVKHGAGRLGQRGTEVTVKTDDSGGARTPFAVSSEAGANTVVATVEGQDKALDFHAFGTEV